MTPASTLRILVALLILVPASASAQVQKITPDDGTANDLFGYEVALNNDGTVALIGARTADNGANSGSVYVYSRVDTIWTREQKLYNSDADAGDLFGENVSMSDDGLYAIVSAPSNKDAGTNTGSAYVLFNNGSSWSEQQKLLASDMAQGDLFGDALDINADGTWAVVAASGDDGPSSFISGTAYVFTRSGTTWTEQGRLYPEPVPTGDVMQYGWNASISGDGNYVAVSGRRIDGSNGQIFERVHVYARSGSTWTLQDVLVPSDSTNLKEFGPAAFDYDGTHLIVGANGDGASFVQVGAVYAYERSGSTWTEVQKIVASDGQSIDEFGVSVSMDAFGNRAVIGSNRGAYVFDRSGSTWVEQPGKLAAPDLARIAREVDVAPNGLYAIAAARADTVNGFNSGSAYAFDLTPVALGVELIGLTATVDGSDVVLAWSTASESENVGFEIERRSADGGYWSAVAWVDGRGTSATETRYRHTVSAQPAGAQRFRLAQYDLDGSVTYSAEVEVTVAGDGSAGVVRLVGANPVRDRASIELALPVSQRVTVAVHDALGRRVAVLKDGAALAGVEVLSFDATAVAPGVYFVVVTGAGVREVGRLVVRR